jgi:lysozyme family protein
VTSSLLLFPLSWILGSTPALANDCGPGAPGVSGDALVLMAQLDGQAPVVRKAKPAPKETATSSEPTGHRPSDKEMAKVYDANDERADTAKPELTRAQERDMASFYENWEKNKAQYQAVADKTGIPGELIAALHWRESTGNFGTYLHQGDKLGKKAVHVPKDIPIFHTWAPAAEHALNMKKWLRDKLKIDVNTADLAALATYAEYYNGLGYSYKGKPSPYVWSGTDQYSRGKYVADGRYSSVTKDKQLGVISMVQHIWDQEAAADVPLPTQSPRR